MTGVHFTNSELRTKLGSEVSNLMSSEGTKTMELIPQHERKQFGDLATVEVYLPGSKTEGFLFTPFTLKELRDKIRDEDTRGSCAGYGTSDLEYAGDGVKLQVTLYE